MIDIKPLTSEQLIVAGQALDFVRSRNPMRQCFLYEGLAGTGKTVVLSWLARRLPGALLCSFMGKAASNLARKTGLPATTLHSAIYEFLGVNAETNQPQFAESIEPGEWGERSKPARAERSGAAWGERSEPAHAERSEAERSMWTGNVALVDESGTVGRQLAQDLLRTGCRVIACGDPGQLNPVNDERFFVDPDAVLRTVHRQAWDSAIIRQAHNVRAGKGYQTDGPDFRVERFVDHEDIVAADMFLCWKNDTRIRMNRLIRAHHGLAANCPFQAGEPVMCLRNDHSRGILNGAIYILREEHIAGRGYLCLTNERGMDVEVPAWIEDFEMPMRVIEGKKHQPTMFAPARCATVHKALGGEWDKVILIDEYSRPEERDQWCYTGITRAAKQIIVQRSW